jgi:type I restriction enzyme S subunit
MNNVTRRGTLEWSSFIRVPADAETIATYSLRRGDVLFNNTNSTEMVGKTALFDRFDEPVVFSNHFTRIRTRADALEPEFLALWLHSQWQSGVFARICDRWIGQSAVQRNKLLELQIVTPPVQEQRRIAPRLRVQLTAVAEARAALEAQLKAADALPAANLRAVFESEEAKRWPRTGIGEICEILARQVNPTEADFADLPHVSGENIESGTLRLLNVRSAREDGMTSGKYLFEPGDVLYSKLRPYLRKVAIAPSRGVCSADMYPLTTRADRIDSTYAAWLLLSEQFTAYAVGESQRSRMPKLNREQLFAWQAPLPTIERQRSVGAKLDEQSAAANQMKALIRDRIAALDEVPAALLRAAFSPTAS